VSGFVRIAVFAKLQRPKFAPKLQEAIDWLRARGCHLVVERKVAEAYAVERAESRRAEEIPARADLVLVFGGDGTMLSVARLSRGSNAAILGINLGSLGFLTAATLDELYPALEAVLCGEHKIDQRGLLKAEVHKSDGRLQTYHALNDIVINKGALARIVRLDASINDDYTATFLADGLIVSTPTGSTAYSLSAGGPIVFPLLDSMVITPICPHTLTNRPLVVPADSRIRIVLRDGEDVMVTMDGQIGLALEKGEEVLCTESEHKVPLVQPFDRSFFDVLRQKLKWGER
jgi:NAD+ kinase